MTGDTWDKTSKRDPRDDFYSILRNEERRLQTLASIYVPRDELSDSNNETQSSDPPTSPNYYQSLLRSPGDQPTKRIKIERETLEKPNNCLEEEESNNSFDAFVDTDAREKLDSLFTKFKEICNLDLPVINQEKHNDSSTNNFGKSRPVGKIKMKEQITKKKMKSVSNFYANLLNHGLQNGMSVSDIGKVAKLMEDTDEDITMLQNKFEKICEAVESNGQYNGPGPNLYGTGVTRFITCSKGCTCILKTSNNENLKCSSCQNFYNTNVQAILLSVRELYREKFKNRKVAEMEWHNVNRYIEELRAQKKENTPDHLQRMMDDGFFDLDNASKKEKVIDIPFAILMDAISVSATTHLGYNATGGFNLAENQLQMKSKENVHPIYIYPKVKSHAPSNKPINENIDAQSSNSDYNTERFFNIENRDNIADNEEELDVTACGIFQPLVNEFISLSKFGFKIYDDFNKEEITVRIHWLYTIGDMAAVSELVGGRYASNLRCCTRCNIFKTPLFYNKEKYTRSVLSFVHCHNEVKNFNLTIAKSMKRRDGQYDLQKNMDFTNSFYMSKILPCFDKKNWTDTGQFDGKSARDVRSSRSHQQNEKINTYRV